MPNIQDIISNLQTELEEMRGRINTMPNVVCDHLICEACQKRIDDQAKEVEELQIIIREKEEILNQLLAE